MNEAAIFEFLVIVLTWRETSLMCLVLLIFCTGKPNVNWWCGMDQYMGTDLECILGPCGVALCAASISVTVNHILMLLTTCEMETSNNYVIVYHKLSAQAKVYEDFLHHDLA